jgi:uncharacterized protein with HEPN domain
MSDLPLLESIMAQVIESVDKIQRRFNEVDTPEDFLGSDAGIDKLDGIVLMLITIGENLKRFEKHGGTPFMSKHPEIDWKGAIGVRDFLSHHYFDLDAEVVFQICKYRIADMKKAVAEILASLQSSLQ